MSGKNLAALVVAVTFVAVSGCGGSSKSSSQSTSLSDSGKTTAPTRTPVKMAPLTRAALINKADAICFTVNAKRASTKITSSQDYARFVPPLAAREQTASAELAKLTPPASMTRDWDQIVSSAKALADSTTKLGEYAKKYSFKEASKLLPLMEHTQQLMIATAKRNGFKDCAQTIA